MLPEYVARTEIQSAALNDAGISTRGSFILIPEVTVPCLTTGGIYC